MLDLLRRGVDVRGRRVQLVRYERPIERRAGSWVGVGPARSGSVPSTPGAGEWLWQPAEALIDAPPGRPAPDDPITGIAVHVGRWLWLLTWLPAPAPRCTCGHPKTAHEHYRPGDDCGYCGRERCPTYQAQKQEGATR